jgi:L-serine dehydratase
MNLFDIVGPVMVGPSSSHTAGAVRIGFVAQKLLGEPVKRARLISGNGNRTRNPESTDCGTFRDGAG